MAQEIIGCKRICIKFKVKKIIGKSMYALGRKNCPSCGVFMKYDGIRCPCCGHVLKTRPSNSKYKQRLIPKKAYH